MTAPRTVRNIILFFYHRTNGLRRLALNYRATNILGLFLFCYSREQTQGLAHTWQILYYWSIFPAYYWYLLLNTVNCTGLSICLSTSLLGPWIKAHGWKWKQKNRVLTIIGIFYSFDLTQLATFVALAEALHLTRNVEKYSGHHRSHMLLNTNLH